MGDFTERDVPLSIDVIRNDATVTVRASGEIDIATVGTFEDALFTELLGRPAILIVDLEPVRFLASMGLSLLARADQTARDGGTEMRVVAANRIITRILELSGLIQELSVFASYADAVTGRPGPHAAHRLNSPGCRPAP